MKFWWAKKSEHTSLIAYQVVLPSIIFLVSCFALILFIAMKFQSSHIRQEQLLSYVEFERISDAIGKSFEVLANESLTTSADVSYLNWTQAGITAVSGTVSELPDWEVTKPKRMVTTPYIMQVLGKPYIAVMTSKIAVSRIPETEPFAITLQLVPFDISKLIQLSRVPLDTSIVYLLSREGQLIFSTSSQINHSNFLSRPIVQKFVLNQINASGLAFTDHDGKKGFGYSFYVPGSNLVMFSEVSSAAHPQGFSTMLRTALVLLGLATLVVGVCFYLVHAKIYGHLRELALSMERSALIPTHSNMKPTKIKELAFLKQTYQQSEHRMFRLYQRIKEQELANESRDDSQKAG